MSALTSANPNPNYWGAEFADSGQLTNSTTSITSKFSGASYGKTVTGIIATSTDPAARVVTVQLYDGSTAHTINAVTVAITSGTDGATAVTDLLAGIPCPCDAKGNRNLFIPNGYSLQFSAPAVTTGKVIDIVILGQTY